MIDIDLLWEKLNKIAEERGEFGFSTLSEEEMKSALEEALQSYSYLKP